MPKPLSIIFAGTPDFALPSLQKLIDDDKFDVKLVITQPNKPKGRKQIITPPPIKVLADKYNILVWQPKNINTEKMPISDCDFLVTVAYGQILQNSILNIPKIAAINLHASLLPRWRGASPMQSAMLAKDKETGISIQRMIAKLDSGPILAQKKVTIAENETIETLHDKLADIGAKLLIETLQQPLKETKQDEKKATTCKKLSRKDGDLNLQYMTAADIYLHVRTLVPWPGVRFVLYGETVKLLKTSLYSTKDSLEIKCKDNTSLFVEILQPINGKPMSAIAWKRGRKVI